MSARGNKRLESSADALRHQRASFADLREQVAAGAPLVVADADAPHEVFRAMGIPYVVNQWWASICSAKQCGPRYLGLLRQRGYPDDLDQYSAITLGSALEADSAEAPWGGLPQVSLFVTQVWTDAHRRVAEAWNRELGVPVFMFEKAVDQALPVDWWDRVADDWEEVIGTARLDLMTSELRGLVEVLERSPGARSTRHGSRRSSSSRMSSRSGAGRPAT